MQCRLAASDGALVNESTIVGASSAGAIALARSAPLPSERLPERTVKDVLKRAVIAVMRAVAAISHCCRRHWFENYSILDRFWIVSGWSLDR
jgi:hypothetical protein